MHIINVTFLYQNSVLAVVIKKSQNVPVQYVSQKKRGSKYRKFGRRYFKKSMKADFADWAKWLNTVHQFFKRTPEVAPLILHPNNDNRPFMNVKIKNKNFVALIDSGSNVTVLGKDALKYIHQLKLQIQPSVHSHVFMADGKEQFIIGEVTLQISIDNNYYQNLNALVIPSVRYPLVLGVDFCNIFKIKLDFESDNYLFTSNSSNNVCAINTIKSADDLNKSHADTLQKIISAYKKLGEKDLGCTSLIEHKIDTGNFQACKQKHHALSPYMQEHLNKELDRMLELDVVQPSKSDWSSPVLLVKKSSGEYRLCFDGRK